MQIQGSEPASFVASIISSTLQALQCGMRPLAPWSHYPVLLQPSRFVSFCYCMAKFACLHVSVCLLCMVWKNTIDNFWNIRLTWFYLELAFLITIKFLIDKTATLCHSLNSMITLRLTCILCLMSCCNLLHWHGIYHAVCYRILLLFTSTWHGSYMLQAAATCYIELIVKESDNNVKLIVLDRLIALKEVPSHEKVLQVSSS